MTEKLRFVLGRVENIFGYREMLVTSINFLFPTMFSKVFYLRFVKNQDSVVKECQSRFSNFVNIIVINSREETIVMFLKIFFIYQYFLIVHHQFYVTIYVYFRVLSQLNGWLLNP